MADPKKVKKLKLPSWLKNKTVRYIDKHANDLRYGKVVKVVGKRRVTTVTISKPGYGSNGLNWDGAKVRVQSTALRAVRFRGKDEPIEDFVPIKQGDVRGR